MQRGMEAIKKVEEAEAEAKRILERANADSKKIVDDASAKAQQKMQELDSKLRERKQQRAGQMTKDLAELNEKQRKVAHVAAEKVARTRVSNQALERVAKKVSDMILGA